MLPIEAKCCERVDSSDARSVYVFLMQNRSNAKIGFIVYRGDELKELRQDVWAVPDWYLF